MIRQALFAIMMAGSPVSAQRAQPTTPPLDPAVASTVSAIRLALIAVTRADRELLPANGAATLRAADDAVMERRAIARARIAAGLDTLLAAGAPGRAAIRTLARDWPGADQVGRAEVRAAFRAKDAADALRAVGELLAATPRDTQLVTWRADALDLLGRRAESLRARQARYEMAPDDEGAWRALRIAHEAAQSLPQLRVSLGRLRLLYPESRAVREHEIEILHRLGRGAEAARIAADTLWGRP
jgi:hypothetical protein